MMALFIPAGRQDAKLVKINVCRLVTKGRVERISKKPTTLDLSDCSEALLRVGAQLGTKGSWRDGRQLPSTECSADGGLLGTGGIYCGRCLC